MLQVEDIGSTQMTAVAATLVRVAGNVDFASARMFRNYLQGVLSTGVNTLILSFEDCEYIDSTALGVLIEMHAAIGTRLKLIVSAQTCVHRILFITGLHRVLNVFSTLSGAIEASPGSPSHPAG